MAISGVSGTLTHGSSVTISGTSFGTKSPAAPLIYDDFQSVTIGSNINTSTATSWASNGGDIGGSLPPRANASNLRSGTPFDRNMQSRWTPSDDKSNVAQTGKSFNGRFFWQAWHYYDSTGSSVEPSNIKMTRFHDDIIGGDGIPNFYLSWSGNQSGDSIACGRDGTSTADNGFFGSSPSIGGSYAGSNFHGQWNQYMQLGDVGSGGGAADGSWEVWVNGTLWVRHTSVATCASSGFTDVFFGNYTRSGDWTGTSQAFWECLYCDTSWARVEIGNNATYGSCTHREIWKPTAWSSTSITATINRGSFASNATVWLFVVDSNNTASSGFQITLGAAGGGSGRLCFVR